MKMAEKLTKAQLRMLASVADWEVLSHFDVYGGYWWTERGTRLPAYGKSESFPPLPIRRLLELKFIGLGDSVRLTSGRRVSAYFITDTGRAALSQARGTAK
jgi:hypothetical protein